MMSVVWEIGGSSSAGALLLSNLKIGSILPLKYPNLLLIFFVRKYYITESTLITVIYAIINIIISLLVML